MWQERFWITTITIASILSFVGSSRAQFTKHIGEICKKSHENELDGEMRCTNITDFISHYNNDIHKTHLHPKLFGDIMANGMNNYVPFSNVNKNCTRDGIQFIKSLNNQTLWAEQMYDSSSKYPGGALMAAEVTEMGLFDQCTSVSSEGTGIRGAYAIAVVRFRFADEDVTVRRPLSPHEVETRRTISGDSPSPRSAGPKTLWWALCVPDSCTTEDVKSSVEHVLIPAFRVLDVVMDVTVPTNMYTSRNSQLPSGIGTLLIYWIFIISCVLVAIGTLYEGISDSAKLKNPPIWRACLQSYSLLSNVSTIMADEKDHKFAITNGLKMIGLISVIAAHRLLQNLKAPVINPAHSEHVYTNFWWSILKSPVIVEIFFVISGFFTFNKIKDRFIRGKPLNFMYQLRSRLVRILPAYVTVLLIFVFVLPYAGNGPLWKHFIYPEAEYCRKNWWTNILFINNYVNTQEICMLHSWYLACDIQFFIVGTFLTYIILRWRRAGLGIFGVLFAASIYLPAKYIYDNRQWGVFPIFPSDVKSIRTTEHFHSIYIKGHYRITTYFIGLATAYVYMQLNEKKVTFSVKNRTIGLILAISLHLACYYVTGYLYLPGLKYNPWNHVLYFTFQRIIYSMTLSYLIVVSSLSNFGPLSSLVESKLFTTTAKLSYVMYLSHFIVQLQSIGRIRQPQYGNNWKVFWDVNADIFTTFLYTMVISLFAEEPIRKIYYKLTEKFPDNEQKK